MRVSAVQFDYRPEEPFDERVQRMWHLLRAATGSDLVVLPELWPNGGFTYENWEPTAEGLDAGLVKTMAEWATELGTVLHGGSFVERRNDGTLANTSLVFDSTGELVATYRKIHLFGFGEGEPKLMSAGAEVVTVPVGETVVGLTTCYDLRFPELYRRLADEGAQVVVVPAAWPKARIEHWSVLARARAIENQFAIVAVNTVGSNGGKQMGGRSVVVDARGSVLAEAGEDEQVVTADIDLADAAAWRERFPVLADRRL